MSKMYLNEKQEKELNYVDRMGLAYCRLNSWEGRVKIFSHFSLQALA